MNQTNQDKSRGYQTENKGTAYVAENITINNQQLSEEQVRKIAQLVAQELISEDKNDFKNRDESQQETKQIDQDLKNREKQFPEQNRRSLIFDEYIREIDFNEARGIFDNILREYRRKDCAILFLIHESESKRGDIYLEEIKDTLKNLKTHFQTYPIGLSSECLLDEEGLLNRIASYFNISERDNQQTVINKTIATICNSLRNGTILLFHLSQWDELVNPSQTLKWFIENFWKPLLNQKSAICKTNKYRQVKIITIIDSPGILDEDCLNLSFVCRFNEADVPKVTQDNVIEIPLTNWKQEEIDDWLALYTTIENDEKRAKESQLIYRRNNQGDPQKTYEALKQIWLNYCPRIE